MALTDIELLTACVAFTLQHTHEAEQQTFKDLETSGATRLVNALRLFRLQRAILAVGMFSMFEALLQSKLKWTQTFTNSTTISDSTTNFSLLIRSLTTGLP